MLFSLLILPLSRSTLFPYTTLFRSLANFQDLAGMVDPAPGELADMHQAIGAAQVDKRAEVGKVAHRSLANLADLQLIEQLLTSPRAPFLDGQPLGEDQAVRSEERRVGKECRARWWGWPERE